MWDTKLGNTSSSFSTEEYGYCCNGEPIPCRCQDKRELEHFKSVMTGSLIAATTIAFAVGIAHLFNGRK